MKQPFESFWKTVEREKESKTVTIPQTEAGTPEWKALKERIQQKAKERR
ncbi:hypothetical protein ABC345_13235 [Shouchella sp. 1P09AA]